MSLVREDMLRELELLPVWRLRTPIAAITLPDTVALAPVDLVAEPPLEKAAELLPEAMIAEPVINEFVIAESVFSEPVIALPPVEEIATPQLTTTEIQPEQISAGPMIESPWFLLCPQASDTTAQQLLQNIVQALKLPTEALHIAYEQVSVTQVQSRFGILFGLQAANRFLGTNHAEIASVRGQLLTHAGLTYIVTHHPQAMLENPLLKKQVWHDLCLLLAQKQD
ncbi:MAG: hypothetical protein ACTS9Y_09020 [Methylophilus sp.]|uniref:hypothetical protein n=1 Tax=Methylophilus sp. TaxID=29541 RepID=UPI003F9F1625